jgi:23S rRNA (pseudouridine1915-N3)-methyltransferase
LGLSDEVLARADLLLSLSKMTFTHEMARLIIVEQMYRAFNILNGTGYHK